MIQRVKGFRDILPDEAETWRQVENTAVGLLQDFGFSEIRLPVLEKAELFQRSIGAHTDIVEKEMYTFPTSKGEMLTLRPEATASVVRAYIEQKLYAKDPVQKLYTLGPMFRRERPQKGRYRQFYQINAEAFGMESPCIDAQMIFLLWTFFEKLSVPGLTVCINSLGCPACRPRFKEALTGLLAEKSKDLCADCLRRRDKNPLRVLDCKVPSCRAALADAPAMIDYLCEDCDRHFKTVLSLLEKQTIPFRIDPRLVRGLDYYTRTAFEIQTEQLGAQNAVAGGGRYDGLVEALGGPKQPAIGFAIGADRLVELMLQQRRPPGPVPDVFIAPMGDQAIEKAYAWSCALAVLGFRTEADFENKSLKAMMKRADRIGALQVLIVGEEELAEGAVILRNMKTKQQASIPINGLVDHVKRLLMRPSEIKTG